MFIGEAQRIKLSMERDDLFDRFEDVDYYINKLRQDIEYSVSRMSIKEKLETFRYFFPTEKYNPNFIEGVVKILSKEISDFKPTKHDYYASVTIKEENFFEKLETILANKHLGIEEAIKKADVDSYNCKMRSVFVGPIG